MKKYWMLCGLLLLACRTFAAEFSIQHLEPANWWVGMKYHQVELMVHGENISSTTPVIDYSGVRLLDTKKVDNPNYLFLTIDIGDAAKPGKFPIRFMRDNQQKSSFTYQLLAREPGSAARKGFSPADAIYLITPDRFANGNPANDKMPGMLELPDRKFNGGRHGGDIAGMSAHLDYVAAMGFTQIWPTPLTENNQPKYSYHGYAATNLYQIDRRYGSNADFKQFVSDARKRGLGVIQDIVLNHIGSSHWWMADLPTKDWVNFPNNYTETSHRRTTIQDPHAAPEDRERFVGGWFVKTMPDLNQRNPFLARYLIQNSIWWVEYAGLSGIREDTYGYSDEKFLSQWGKALLDEYPDFTMVGEEWSNNPSIVAHWQRGKINPDGHIPYMPSMMDFPIHEALRTALAEPEAWGTGTVRLYEALANDFIYPDPDKLVIFAENHDTSRIYSLLNEDVDLFKMAMVYMASMRGIPQFYYGSEILMTSPKERDDGAVRADMPGGWKGDAKNAFTAKGLTAKERDMQAFMKKLLNWRKSSEVIHHGKLQHFAPVDGVYVYVRYLDKRAVMVVLNKNNEPKVLQLNRFHQFVEGKTGMDVMSGAVLNLHDSLSVPAKTAQIIELN